MQDHIKIMTEICDEFSAIGEHVSDEDRVVYLLASLPESYGVLVTALEAGADVSSLAVVRECLLQEETKMNGKQIQTSQETSQEGVYIDHQLQEKVEVSVL